MNFNTVKATLPADKKKTQVELFMTGNYEIA